MTHPSNPTSSSAVVGQRLRLRADPGRLAAIAKELTTPALLTAFALYLVVGIVTMQVPDGTPFPGPAVFPGLVAAALLVLAGLLVVRSVRASRAGARAGLSEGSPTDAVDGSDAPDAPGTGADGSAVPERTVRVDWRSLLWVVVSFGAFALLLDVLGWVVGAGLLFLGVAKGLGAPGWLRPLVVGFTVSAISYIAFDMALELSLPSGILGWGS